MSDSKEEKTKENVEKHEDVKLPEDKKSIFEVVKNIFPEKTRDESLEEAEERKPSIFERFVSLPIIKKIAVVFLIILLVGIGYTLAGIISNIISGTITVTGITISLESPIPSEMALETIHNNTLRISNPSSAGMSGRITFNFTSTFAPSTTSIRVWVDINRNGIITTDEELSGIVYGNTLKFSTPNITIPSGFSNFKFQIKFVDTRYSGKQVDYKIYAESS